MSLVGPGAEAGRAPLVGDLQGTEGRQEAPDHTEVASSPFGKEVFGCRALSPGTAVALFVAEALFVTLAPDMSVPEQSLETVAQPAAADSIKPPAGRQDVRFNVGDTYISAWLYLPEDVSTQVPCIIMGHGFGGTKDMLLEQYAVRYQAAGYAVLAFDYRHFGESGGEPRQLMLLSYQLEDYRAAIQYVRGLSGWPGQMGLV